MDELFRITGVNELGARKTLFNKKGPAIYTQLPSAKKALSQFTRRYGFHDRWYSDMRIERADTDWAPTTDGVAG